MCAGCAGSRDKAIGTLERHQILSLALQQPSFLLGRPHSTKPSPAMRATAGRKGLVAKVENVRFETGGGVLGLRFVWEEGVAIEGWWHSSRGRLLDDESGIEMESVYGHCSLNQPS